MNERRPDVACFSRFLKQIASLQYFLMFVNQSVFLSHQNHKVEEVFSSEEDNLKVK